MVTRYSKADIGRIAAKMVKEERDNVKRRWDKDYARNVKLSHWELLVSDNISMAVYITTISGTIQRNIAL